MVRENVLAKLRSDKRKLMRLLAEQRKATSTIRRVRFEKAKLLKDVKRLKLLTGKSLLARGKRLAVDKRFRGRVTKPLRRAKKQLGVAKRKARKAFSSFQDFADRFGS